MDRKIAILGNVLFTLNQISVQGEPNLNKMLGCIQSIAEVKSLLQEERSVPEVSADGSNGD